ncbi:metal-dependent transcriptional regulator [Leifsonia sp. YAF41]|uniref:metal-dependent transcriptional regulator n=1 Tax=Leifsonia sp. YAF41 TaxID=3233086 RepID=UPI003F95DC0E
MKQITVATEDYLKTIYAHTEWQNNPITPSVLAVRLGVAPPSVTEMVKKLAASGLITHVPYGPLTLTDEGLRLATAVVRRHRLIETWLVRELGYSWDEVHEEAEVLEHAMSDRLLAAIDLRLGSPTADPHGDLIPAVDGTVTRVPAVQLYNAELGHSGTVLRISDRDPGILRDLAADGIMPGSTLTVTGRTADDAVTVRLGDGPVDSTVDGAAHTLAADVAGSIWLSA